MAVAKVLIGEVAVGLATAAAAHGLNGLAESVVLFTGALAGVLWLWAKILRPVAATVRRTAAAAAHLEELPAWRVAVEAHRERTDHRLSELENSLGAVLRDLNITSRDTGERP